MSNVALNKLVTDERRQGASAELASGLVRIPQSAEQQVRRLNLVDDAGFNAGARALYRQLSAYRSPEGKSIRTLGLTSCYRNEGTSTVGVYLSTIAAESRRTLFIDANEPRLRVRQEMRDVALNGKAFRSDAVLAGQPVQAPAAASAPSDAATAQPSMDEIRDLLRLLSVKFDLIVVDLPPLDSTNVLDWAPLIDGIVLVVESERVRWQVAARGVELLEQAGAQVLGTVINKQREYIPQWLYERL
jgi:Mrp family chromosome partitioning ATPase